jgi:hypothetical protein
MFEIVAGSEAGVEIGVTGVVGVVGVVGVDVGVDASVTNV